jgi:hypothetical protein
MTCIWKPIFILSVFFAALIALIGPRPHLWKFLEGLITQERLATANLKDDLIEVSLISAYSNVPFSGFPL